MTLVVDASVVVAALVDAGPLGSWAEAQLSSAALIAPHLMPVEVSNVLRIITPVEPALEQTGIFDAIQASIDRAWARGVVVIVAAGNNYAPWCSDPAALRHAICVGGVDETRQHVAYSHSDLAQRSTLIVAPTSANLPTHSAVLVAKPGGGYGETAGTSFAAPMAVGVAALLAAQGLHGQALVDRLLATCTDLGLAGRDGIYGYGEVDAAKAVKRA